MRIKTWVPCKEEFCERIAKGRGWCNTHLMLVRRHGTPHHRRPTAEERVWRRISIQPNGCWLWTGSTTRGYGVLLFAGKQQYAHRIVWRIMCGPIPETTPHLDHLCRVPLCVNPGHLEPVTQGENNRRAWQHRTNRRKSI